MVRTPYCDKSGLKKGTWTPEEDWKLIAYVTTHGHKNWRQLPKFAGNRSAPVNYDLQLFIPSPKFASERFSYPYLSAVILTFV